MSPPGRIRLSAGVSDDLLEHYGGRPTPVTECRRLGERLGIRLLLKREDLVHTGSHKLNNVIGQALLAERMGKRRLIAETGAGQHGVAAATAAALLGLECVVYMGAVDVERQGLNVFRMQLLGSEVRPVSSGSRTLKDAINEALRDWVATVETTHYCIGSVMGPQLLSLHGPGGSTAARRGRGPRSVDELLGFDPDVVVACVGGGWNAAGTFAGFVGTPARLVGVEAAGGAAMSHGVPGVVHGMRSRFLQDEHGQILRGGLDICRPGLSGDRPRACQSRSRRTCRIPLGRRFRGARGLPPAGRDRRDNPRPGAGSWARLDRERGQEVDPRGFGGAPDTVRPRRQRRGPGAKADAVTAGTTPAPGVLEAALRDRRDVGRKLLVPYVTGGLGQDWLEIVRAVAAAGADAVEIGIPFSDPVMDGPIIQRASAEALRSGATPAGIIASLARADAGVPLAVMTYYNIMFRAGHRRMARTLADAGVSGAIVPDLPIDELDGWGEEAHTAGIETVLPVAPTTPNAG